MFVRELTRMSDIYCQLQEHGISLLGFFVRFTSKRVDLERERCVGRRLFQKSNSQEGCSSVSRNSEGSFEEVTFLHDMGGYMRSIGTHSPFDRQLLYFFVKRTFGCELESCGNIGAIVKERAEDTLIDLPDDPEIWKKTLIQVLNGMETDLFSSYLTSSTTVINCQ